MVSMESRKLPKILSITLAILVKWPHLLIEETRPINLIPVIPETSNHVIDDVDVVASTLDAAGLSYAFV